MITITINIPYDFKSECKCFSVRCSVAKCNRQNNYTITETTRIWLFVFFRPNAIFKSTLKYVLIRFHTIPSLTTVYIFTVVKQCFLFIIACMLCAVRCVWIKSEHLEKVWWYCYIFVLFMLWESNFKLSHWYNFFLT